MYNYNVSLFHQQNSSINTWELVLLLIQAHEIGMSEKKVRVIANNIFKAKCVTAYVQLPIVLTDTAPKASLAGITVIWSS